MARIRTIKPEFWTDGNIVVMGPWERLFYIGSWNFTICHNGHLPDDPMSLKLKILPMDDVDPFELVNNIIAAGRFVRKTTPEGRSYLHIPRLADHQKVDARWKPRCPFCTESRETTPNHADTSASPAATSASPTEPPSSPPEPAEPPENPTEPRPGTPKLPEGGDRRGGEGIGGDKSVSDAARSDATNPHPDAQRICDHLASRIAANGSKRPTITTKWLDEARRLLAVDKRDPDSVIDLIDWCQADQFWRSVVLSMPTFRTRFDTIRLQRERAPALATGGHQPFRNPDPDDYDEEL